MSEIRGRHGFNSLASLSVFVFSAAQVLWVALFPFLAERLNLALSTVIASFALGSFLFVFGSPYWASKSDEYGRGAILSLGLAALFFSFAVLVYLVASPFQTVTLNLGFLLLSRIVYGFIASAIVPVAQAIQADAARSDTIAKAMATHSMSLGLGRVAGLSLLVLPQVSREMSYVENVLYFVLAAIGSALFLSLLSARGTLPSKMARSGNDIRARSWFSELGDIKFVVLIAFLFASFVEAVNSSLAGRIQSLFQIDGLAAAQWSAKMLLAASIGIVLVQAVYRASSRSRSRRGLALALGVGVFALFSGSVLFASARATTEFIIAISFFVIGIGLIPPVYLSLLRSNHKTNRDGRRAGIVGSAQTLGYAFGAGLSAISFRLGVAETGYILCLIVVGLAITCVLQTKAASV